jgi:hypothetical protein
MGRRHFKPEQIIHMLREAEYVPGHTSLLHSNFRVSRDVYIH